MIIFDYIMSCKNGTISSILMDNVHGMMYFILFTCLTMWQTHREKLKFNAIRDSEGFASRVYQKIYQSIICQK